MKRETMLDSKSKLPKIKLLRSNGNETTRSALLKSKSNSYLAQFYVFH